MSESNLEVIPERANDIGITVELTSRCNLRCAYCSVPHSKSYGAEDMPPSQREKAHQLITKHQKVVGKKTILSLSGRGELTFIPNWQDLIHEFKIDDVEIRTVANLAKPLTFDEAKSLALLDVINVSIDTVDSKILKKIRKSVDLKNVISNINMIRAAGIYQNSQKTIINIYAVVTEGTVFDICKLTALAISLGATSLVLLDLVMDYSDTVSDSPIRHISSLPQAQLKKAASILKDAQELASKHGLDLSLRSGLREAYEIADGKTKLTTIEIESSQLGNHKRIAKKVSHGKTRYCLQPWRMVLLAVNGGIELCCGAYGNIGSWEDKNSIIDIMNSPEARQLRKELLTGNLRSPCQICTVAPEIEIAEFQARVEKLFEDIE